MYRIQYKQFLKPFTRALRANMTDAEHLLWSKIRRKQILGIQFYRQKALGVFIVDFFGPKAQLVIELDGSQHLEPNNQAQDKYRDEYMNALGLTVLRFYNGEVIGSIDTVLTKIHCIIQDREIPPPYGRPPFKRGQRDLKPQ
jgi:very-short-patch-repair endonuclease